MILTVARIVVGGPGKIAADDDHQSIGDPGFFRKFPQIIDPIGQFIQQGFLLNIIIFMAVKAPEVEIGTHTDQKRSL